MAGGMDLGTSTKGGKRSLDAAINLVPFIDGCIGQGLVSVQVAPTS